MKCRSDVATDDTRAVEVGTVAFQGREFSAGGFSVDVERGRMVAYVTTRPTSKDGKSTQSFLTTWNGETIARLIWTGYARGFNRTRLECYSTAQPVAGYYWYGRGLGAGMVLKLRRGRKES